MNKYLIIFVAIIFVTMGIAIKVIYNNNQKLKAENSRIADNNIQLMAENRQITNLRLKDSEVIGEYRRERDSALKTLKLRQKEILKIITNTVTVRDTILKEVPVQVIGKDHWLISDTGKCYVWKGEARLSDDSLKVKKTLFSYHNKTTEVFYKKRPHRFLFIRYGRWEYLQQLSDDCNGEVRQKTIEFIR